MSPLELPFAPIGFCGICRRVKTRCLFTNASSSAAYASMTSEGNYAALSISNASIDALSGVYVYDVQSAQRIFTNALSTAGLISIAPTGNRIAYFSNNSLLASDLTPRTNRNVAPAFSSKRTGLRFSADSRFLVYSSKQSSTATNIEVWLYDFMSGTNLLISRRFATGTSAGGISDSPDISPDGRYVAYRSDSPNILPGDTNSVPDIFIYDRIANSTRLVSLDSFGSGPANNRSVAPVFSGDSKILLFGGWAGNLVGSDYTQGADLFITGLSAVITDSDGDAMDDAWELLHFGTLSRDGAGDYDGDGSNDLSEFLAGTDPEDGSSTFRVQLTSGSPANTSIILSWPAVVNRSYRAEYKANLADPSWLPLSAGSFVSGNQGFAYDNSPGSAQRFYRVSVLP